MKKFMSFVIFVSAIFSISGSLSAQGKVTGSVIFDGVAPKPAMLKASKDQFCITSLKGAMAEDLIVSAKNKGIQNVVVSIEGAKGKLVPPEENPVLDQVKCHYSPHVLAVVAGTTVDVHTSDPVNHNVRSNAEENEAVNWAMPFQDMTLPYELEEPEIIKLSCDVHSWMSSYIVVLDTPYFAVTDEDGGFEIPKVPAGKYTVNAWHETLGTLSQEVTVPTTGEVKLSLKLVAKK